MHEVGDDQSCLYHRENHQNFQHAHRLEELLVGHKDLNSCEDEQGSPNPEILGLVLVVCCGYGMHRDTLLLNQVTPTVACHTRVDINYTSGKMNIHTRPT